MGILQIIHRIDQASAKHLADAGCPISRAQLAVLEAISSNPGATQTVYVEMSGIDRSTLSDITRRLERDGYVKRKRSSNDARAWFVAITPSGVAVLKSAKSPKAKAEAALVAQFPFLRQAAAE